MPIPHQNAVISCDHCTDLQYSPEHRVPLSDRAVATIVENIFGF
jgi:hypothetical protein